MSVTLTRPTTSSNAKSQAAMRQNRQSAPVYKTILNDNKENVLSATPTKAKSILKRPDTETKKAKAANRDKRRVSFSSLHNVRFFSSDTNNNSPSKRRKVVEIATPQEEDDFAREKDLLSLDFANEDSQLPSDPHPPAPSLGQPNEPRKRRNSIGAVLDVAQPPERRASLGGLVPSRVRAVTHTPEPPASAVDLMSFSSEHTGRFAADNEWDELNEIYGDERSSIDRRQSVSSLHSPPTHQPRSSASVSQLLFDSPPRAAASSDELERRKSLMEFIGTTVTPSASEDQSPESPRGVAENHTGSVGALLRKRGVLPPSAQPTSMGNILRNGGSDGSTDPARSRRGSFGAAMDLTTPLNRTIGSPDQESTMTSATARLSAKTRRFSIGMDMTNVIPSNIQIAGLPEPIHIGGPSDDSDEDGNDKTMSMTQTFANTRRLSVGMEQTEALGRILGLSLEPQEGLDDSILASPAPSRSFAAEMERDEPTTTFNARTQVLGTGMDFTVSGGQIFNGDDAMNSTNAPYTPEKQTASRQDDDPLSASPFALSASFFPSGADTAPGSPMNMTLQLNSTRRKSIGMDFTVNHGTILGNEPGSPEAPHSSRRKSVGMDMTAVIGGILDESDGMLDSPAANKRQSIGMDLTSAHGAIIEANRRQSVGMDMTQALGSIIHDEDVTLSSRARRQSTCMELTRAFGSILPASDEIAPDRRKSVGMDLTRAYDAGIRVADNEATGPVVDELPATSPLHVQAPQSQSSPFSALSVEANAEMLNDISLHEQMAELTRPELAVSNTYTPLVTPNTTATLRTEDLTDFPFMTPIPGHITSRSSEPITLERFVLITALKFTSIRRSSLVRGGVVEPRSENSKMKSFFVSKSAAELHEQKCSQLQEAIAASRTRIHELEQRIRSQAPAVFAALQNQSDRDVSKLAASMKKLKNFIKYDVKTQVSEKFTGKCFEESQLRAVLSSSEKLAKDAETLQRVGHQQQVDLECIQLEKDAAFMRRHAQQASTRKATRAAQVRKAEPVKQSTEEHFDKSTILGGITGLEVLEMTQNQLNLVVKQTVHLRISKNHRTNKIDSVHCELAPSPLFIQKYHLSFASSLLQHANVPALFDGVKDSTQMAEGIRMMLVKVTRIVDLIHQVTQVQRLFLTEAVTSNPQAAPALRVFFSSWKTKSKFAVRLTFDQEPTACNQCSIGFEHIFGHFDKGAIHSALVEQRDAGSAGFLVRLMQKMKLLVDTPLAN